MKNPATPAQNINAAVKFIREDLTSKKPVLVNMKINGTFTDFNISNYFASYQTSATDLILIENQDFAFTVSTWDHDLTIGQQIRETLLN
jgi:predicted transcriptional regulator